MTGVSFNPPFGSIYLNQNGIVAVGGKLSEHFHLLIKSAEIILFRPRPDLPEKRGINVKCILSARHYHLVEIQPHTLELGNIRRRGTVRAKRFGGIVHSVDPEKGILSFVNYLDFHFFTPFEFDSIIPPFL